VANETIPHIQRAETFCMPMGWLVEMPAKGTSPRERWNPLLKSYPDSEKVNAVSISAETMFTRLVAKADDYGNYWASPRMLLSGLFRLRWEHGEVNETDMVRWRNELVTCSRGPLIACYSVDGVDYLHLINSRRRFRADTEPHIEVPREPANLVEKATSEHVTRTNHRRNRDVPLDLDLEVDQDLDQEEPSSKKDESYMSKKGRKLTGNKLAWFKEFWTAFDYAKGKAAAADSWLDIKHLNRELVDLIVEGAKKEAARRKTLRDDQTPKMAQGWLTDRRWEDDYEAGKRALPPEYQRIEDRMNMAHDPSIYDRGRRGGGE
jgi:hypothetical protein